MRRQLLLIELPGRGLDLHFLVLDQELDDGLEADPGGVCAFGSVVGVVHFDHLAGLHRRVHARRPHLFGTNHRFQVRQRRVELFGHRGFLRRR
ncbi:hypothetical protein [[Mycobacterium] burgundiense]|uniref:Uncharacterized protein n=1 Tax=[Mycobacterium] burgundiense TaxID=3064286 RepID=A0ABM9LVY6_9MYCO|nr:hypothetical protein [Mycolicibacterium sp. MU0053]CAJ1505624.1 hypothetical protein MU0053_002982 [Mycolicibacterium sp. MU0053]